MASGVYQDTSGQVKVVVGSKSGGRGLFVVAGPAIPPQEFNLETTPREGFKHVFIKFDENAQPPTYSELWVNNRSYRVTGNLTLSVGGLATVNIDNNNPYLSVVTEGSAATGGKPSIVGFSGLNEVVRGSGSTAVILAANQLNSDVAAVIRPYVIDADGLLLNGRPISTPTVGTFIKPDNVCLNPSVIVLNSEQLAQVQGAPTEDGRVHVLEKIIANNKKSSPLKGQLVLRTDANSVLLLDVQEKNVREMRLVKGAKGRRKLCLVADIQIK